MKPLQKRGVHFSKFKTNEVIEISMQNFNPVDKDAVFSEEHLSRPA